MAEGKIESVTVKRGSPCGATWEAVKKIIGSPAEDAPTHIGLKVQFFCSADPAGWDPIYGKSPVHFAGNVHAKALAMAIKSHLEPEN